MPRAECLVSGARAVLLALAALCTPILLAWLDLAVCVAARACTVDTNRALFYSGSVVAGCAALLGGGAFVYSFTLEE